MFDQNTPPQPPLQSAAPSIKPTPPATEQRPDPVEPKARKLNLKLVIIIVAVGLLLASGVAFGYTYYQKLPEINVNKAISNIMEVKSVEYSGEIIGHSLKSEKTSDLPIPTDEMNLNISFTGQTDVNDQENPKSSLVLNIQSMDPAKSNDEIEVEIISLNKVTYIKFNGIGKSGLIDLSSITNQWIKFDLDALKEQFGQGDLSVIDEELEKQEEQSKEKLEKVKQAIRDSDVIKVLDKLASENINGHSTYHYLLTFKKEEMKDLILKIMEILKDKPLDQSEIAEFEKGWPEATMPELEIWLGKKDKLPYKLLFSWDLSAVDQLDASGEITFTLMFNNYNLPVGITEPEEAMGLEEVLFGLLSGSMLETLSGDELDMEFLDTEEEFDTDFENFDMDVDLETDNDNDGLPDYLESFYLTDPNNPDSDGDGFTDGEEVEAGYNPMGDG